VLPSPVATGEVLTGPAAACVVPSGIRRGSSITNRAPPTIPSTTATRPEGVVTALLEHEGGHGRLVAVWRDRETLDRYLAEADVPRGTELMRKLGLEPDVRRFDVLDLG